eukprot:1158354-Pelagomonas_calceolata.AAC.3
MHTCIRSRSTQAGRPVASGLALLPGRHNQELNRCHHDWPLSSLCSCCKKRDISGDAPAAGSCSAVDKKQINSCTRQGRHITTQNSIGIRGKLT